MSFHHPDNDNHWSSPMPYIPLVRQLIAAGLTPVMMPNDTIGIQTGPETGVVAIVDNQTNLMKLIHRFDGNLPATCKNANSSTGWRIVYGADVLLAPGWTPDQQNIAPLHEQSIKLWRENLYV